jgi:hypothetical protein
LSAGPWGWNEARPVLERDRAGCANSGLDTVSCLHSLGVEVIEVDRPNRQLRRAQGKSDTVDAIEAARAVLSGRATGVAKTPDGNVEGCGRCWSPNAPVARPGSRA